ncbi:MAG TPA: glycogen synthase [Candidatus Tectomicrobia bacterium]|nr:glycogen synthase [Candidatus Tectomicrobia bacterium]
MHIVILTNEYPPHVYGGAGVHVEFLARQLANLEDQAHDVTVLCFGDQRLQEGNLTVEGVEPEFAPPFQDPRHRRFLDTMVRDIVMAGSVGEADIVHCHTWYSHLAGCLLKPLLGARLVLTTHSLEPHRPWKAEQLGSAYQASSWVERTAYQNADGVIAVSEAMRRDVQALYAVPIGRIRVIHNGIDVTQFKPTPDPSVLQSYGIAPDRPFVLFVGRITRQKGVLHLVETIRYLHPGVQVVLCAGAPDTPAIEQEMAAAVERARAESPHAIIWVQQMVPREDLIRLYTHASVFVCPSIYEPFGIINLEAMACQTPVVATAVGGIPEAVIHAETGLLVPFEPVSSEDFEPRKPEQFARDLAAAVNRLLEDAATVREMGRKARQRVERSFSWTSIAQRTLEFYRQLTKA